MASKSPNRIDLARQRLSSQAQQVAAAEAEIVAAERPRPSRWAGRRRLIIISCVVGVVSIGAAIKIYSVYRYYHPVRSHGYAVDSSEESADSAPGEGLGLRRPVAVPVTPGKTPDESGSGPLVNRDKNLDNVSIGGRRGLRKP